MIDYHLSPSFIISRLPSHLLSDTLSSDLYSTEFEQYLQLIQDIYHQVNKVLSQVQGYAWTGRLVPQAGLVVNSYQKDEDSAIVIINYTGQTHTFQGHQVAPQSAMTVMGGTLK